MGGMYWGRRSGAQPSAVIHACVANALKFSDLKQLTASHNFWAGGTWRGAAL